MRLLLVLSNLSFLLTLLLQPNAAIGSNPNCASASILAESAFDCDRNAFFSKESLRCVDAFEDEISRESTTLSKRLNSKVQKSLSQDEAQRLTLAVAEQSFNHSEKTLRALLEKGIRNQHELQFYLRKIRLPITWPKDVQRPSPDDPSLVQQFGDEICFSENRAIVVNGISEMMRMNQELSRTIANNSRLEKNSLAYKRSMNADNESQARTVRSLTGLPVIDVQRKKSPNNASTITSRKEPRHEIK